MQISAEIRWFFQGPPSATLEDWFHQGDIEPGGGGRREDVYLLDVRQRELGLKKRGGKPGIEIKGLVATLPPCDRAPFTGPLELWTKWTTEALAIDTLPLVTVNKTRWLRKYDTSGASIQELPLDADERPRDTKQVLPSIGCNVELTSIDLPGVPMAWSTLGFEAFGPLGAVETSLRRVIDHLAPRAPAIVSTARLSYPAWLCLVHPPTG